MKCTKSFLVVLLVLAMLASIVPAYAEGNGSSIKDYTEPMKLTVYNGTGTIAPPNQKENLLVQWYENTLHIDISETEFLGGAPSPDERLGLMVASGDMPDIVCFWTSPTVRRIAQQFVDADMVLEVEDYLRKDMPNIMQDLTETSIDYFRADDGKLYVIPSFGINPDNKEAQYTMEPNLTYIKRTDIWEAQGITENPKTPDELYEVLKKLSTVQSPDDRAFIPFEPFGGPSTLITPSAFEQMIGGMFGVFTHRKDINEEEKRFTNFREFPEYVAFLKYSAKLYREGLVDPEPFVEDGGIIASTRAKEGRVGVGITWPNDIDVLTFAAQAVDPKAMYNAFPIPKAEGVTKTDYWQTNAMPAMMTLVSKKTADPERVMKMLDFGNSTEGWLIACYGAPDKERSCWWEEDGKYMYDQAKRDAYIAGNPLYENQILGQWTYFMTGRLIYHINHHGFANVTESPDAQRMEAREYNLPEVFLDPDWELVQGIPAGPVEEVKTIALDKVFKDGYQKIIMEAKDDDAVQSMYDQMMADANAAGFMDVMKERYETYQAFLADQNG